MRYWHTTRATEERRAVGGHPRPDRHPHRAVSEAVREAVDGLPGINLCAPREAELKGLQGTHQLYAVKVPA